jgi:hypothetical protein
LLGEGYRKGEARLCGNEDCCKRPKAYLPKSLPTTINPNYLCENNIVLVNRD